MVTTHCHHPSVGISHDGCSEEPTTTVGQGATRFKRPQLIQLGLSWDNLGFSSQLLKLKLLKLRQKTLWFTVSKDDRRCRPSQDAVFFRVIKRHGFDR